MLPIQQPQGEKDAWFALKPKLGLYNPNKFQRSNSLELWFTSNNFGKGPQQNLKSLDWAVLSEQYSFYLKCARG